MLDMTIDGSNTMSYNQIHNHHSHHSALSYTPQLHFNNENNQQNFDWSNSYGGSYDFPFQSQSGVPFAHHPSGNNTFPAPYALSDPQRYNVFDRSFSSPLAQELLPPMPAARSGASLDPTSIHPSRSAPPSCSSSPLAPGTSTDYLDVPTRMDGSTSREHSPAKSDNDPGDARRRLPCLMEGCSRRFTNQYTLRVHMDAHKPKPKQTFPCTLGCSEKFSRQHDRLRHEVSKHGKVCEFLCDACGRFFSSRKTLGNHKCPVAHGTTRWMDD
ncbi:hypothetical protein AX15_000989 [Amanita polypyramis BW_CC]|nr:hypothetical protein AX15_000989 [Amanita polypyramis BW_CC]